MSQISESIITLDIGGKIFRSYRKTLTKYDSKIKLILEGEMEGMIAKNAIFLDVGFKHFDIVLDAMRYDKLILPPKFLEMKALRHLVEQLWFFDLIKALDRTSDKFLGQRRPLRYACAKVSYSEEPGLVCSLIANPDIYTKTQSHSLQKKQVSSQDETTNFIQSCESLFQQNVVYESSKSLDNRFSIFAYFDKPSTNQQRPINHKEPLARRGFGNAPDVRSNIF